MLNKIVVKLSLALALLAGLVIPAYQTTVAHAHTSQTEIIDTIYCRRFDEGRISITLSGDVTLTAVSFNPAFCQTPQVIVIRDEQEDNVIFIEVGVVTTRVAWFVIYGPPGQTVDFSWQALILTPSSDLSH